MYIDPYLHGALSNFVLEPTVSFKSDDYLSTEFQHDETLDVIGNNDSYFFIHNRFCPTKQIIYVHSLYEQLVKATEKNSVDILTKSKITYNGQKVYFKCFLKQIVLNTPFCPYLDDSRDYWKFFTGIVDMNSVLSGNSEDVNLNIYSKSLTFLQQIEAKLETKYKAQILKDSERSLLFLSFSFVHAIDFFGKLISSLKQREFNLILHGKATLPKCLVQKQDPRASLPSKIYKSDVGYNISIIQKSRILNESTTLYDTGIVLKIPHKYYVQIVPLPILASYGYMLANGTQIIPRSHEGNLLIPLTRISNYAITLDDKLPFCCCQILFHRQCYLEIEEFE